MTMEVVVARIAGLDVHKETVMACVRAPGEAGKRRQVVREFSTFTAELVQLKDWLAAEGVTQVVMEATRVYWRPVWHVLELAGLAKGKAGPAWAPWKKPPMAISPTTTPDWPACCWTKSMT